MNKMNKAENITPADKLKNVCCSLADHWKKHRNETLADKCQCLFPFPSKVSCWGKEWGKNKSRMKSERQDGQHTSFYMQYNCLVTRERWRFYKSFAGRSVRRLFLALSKVPEKVLHLSTLLAHFTVAALICSLREVKRLQFLGLLWLLLWTPLKSNSISGDQKTLGNFMTICFNPLRYPRRQSFRSHAASFQFLLSSVQMVFSFLFWFILYSGHWRCITTA